MEENKKDSGFEEEKIPLNIPSTVEPVQESTETSTIQNMEVHHHAHDPAAPHHKKNWKSYFWEFLMLFLAVFCGFLAEYQLEHKIEKERGNQYIISFYNDLKYDTAHLAAVINNYKIKSQNLSVISKCYDSLILKLSCNNCFTNLNNASAGFFELRTSDRTMQQLKNAGGLRLLESSDADSILGYDNLIRGYKLDEATTFQETQTAIRSISAELFNYTVIKDGNLTDGDLFITTDKIIINKYFNTMDRYAKHSAMYVIKLERLKLKAINIMNYFNGKYSIE